MSQQKSIKDNKSMMSNIKDIKIRTTDRINRSGSNKNTNEREDMASCPSESGPSEGPRGTEGLVVEVVSNTLEEKGE